jgi:hypothetical protein
VTTSFGDQQQQQHQVTKVEPRDHHANEKTSVSSNKDGSGGGKHRKEGRLRSFLRCTNALCLISHRNQEKCVHR